MLLNMVKLFFEQYKARLGFISQIVFLISWRYKD